MTPIPTKAQLDILTEKEQSESAVFNELEKLCQVAMFNADRLAVFETCQTPRRKQLERWERGGADRLVLQLLPRRAIYMHENTVTLFRSDGAFELTLSKPCSVPAKPVGIKVTELCVASLPSSIAKDTQ